MKKPLITGLFAEPTPWIKIVFAVLPFAAIIAVYLFFSDARLEANPSDKLLPSLQQMASAIERLAFEPSKRTGEYLFWTDTFASLHSPTESCL